MSIIKSYYGKKSLEWSRMDKNKREQSARNCWTELDLNERKELLELSGYRDKYAELSYDSLTPELQEMVKFVFVTI